MPNQTETLTPDEQELLWQYRAQASPAIFATKSPLVIDPFLTPMTASKNLSKMRDQVGRDRSTLRVNVIHSYLMTITTGALT